MDKDHCGFCQRSRWTELKDKISDTISQMYTPQIMFDISPESIDDKQILTVQVFPGNATPYYIKSQGKENGTYIRLGTTTRNADWISLDELINRGRHIFYDALPYTNLPVTESDIAYLCKDFSERAKREITRKDLENFNLLIGNDKNIATNAYAILLGKHAYTSRIQCARFRGKERVDFLDKKDYEGPLCEQIDNAYKFVLNHLHMAIEINGIVHTEHYELPAQAIRELIINAAIHRNYQQAASIQVAVYDDRVEISSPGSWYGTLTLEEALSGRSSIRNQTLARTLEKIDVLEGWGSGFKRILALCANYDVQKPEFLEIGDLLRVNFYRPSYKERADKSAIKHEGMHKKEKKGKQASNVTDHDRVNVMANDRVNVMVNDRVIEIIRMNPAINVVEIANALQKSERQTRRIISELKKNGILKRVGADKNGHWEVKASN